MYVEDGELLFPYVKRINNCNYRAEIECNKFFPEREINLRISRLEDLRYGYRGDIRDGFKVYKFAG